MVGLSLMKVSLWSQIVRPPITTTMTPENSCSAVIRRISAKLTAIEMRMAAMNTPVAKNDAEFAIGDEEQEQRAKLEQRAASRCPVPLGG